MGTLLYHYYLINWVQEWTIDMTGQISPTRRACFWKTKRVFFVTPQVLEKDIQAGNIRSHTTILLPIYTELYLNILCIEIEWRQNVCCIQKYIRSFPLIYVTSFHCVPSLDVAHKATCCRHMFGKTPGLFGDWWGSSSIGKLFLLCGSSRGLLFHFLLVFLPLALLMNASTSLRS